MTLLRASRLVIALVASTAAGAALASGALYPFAEAAAPAPAAPAATASSSAVAGTLAGLDALGPRTSVNRVSFAPVQGLFKQLVAGADLEPPGIDDPVTEEVGGLPLVTPGQGAGASFIIDLGSGKLLTRNPRGGACGAFPCGSPHNPPNGATP